MLYLLPQVSFVVSLQKVNTGRDNAAKRGQPQGGQPQGGQPTIYH